MRVNGLFSQTTYLRQLENVRAKREDALLRLASGGKRVINAADDPAAARKLMTLADNASKAAAERRTLSFAKPILEETESALGELGNILERANALAVQAASDTIDPDQRATIADEIAHLRDVVTRMASTKISGRYIFSGTRPDTPPYDSSGIYQGGSSAGTFEIESATMPRGTTALEAFGEDGSGAIGVLQELENALRADDTVAIRAASENIAGEILSNSNVRAGMGFALENLDSLDVALQQRELRISTEASELGALDLAKAISDAELYETSYQAALAAGARLLGPTLFDFIG